MASNAESVSIWWRHHVQIRQNIVLLTLSSELLIINGGLSVKNGQWCRKDFRAISPSWRLCHKPICKLYHIAVFPLYHIAQIGSGSLSVCHYTAVPSDIFWCMNAISEWHAVLFFIDAFWGYLLMPMFIFGSSTIWPFILIIIVVYAIFIVLFELCHSKTGLHYVAHI